MKRIRISLIYKNNVIVKLLAIVIFICSYKHLRAETDTSQYVVKYTVHFIDRNNFISAISPTFMLVDSLKTGHLSVDSVILEIHEDSVNYESSRSGKIFFNEKLDEKKGIGTIKTRYYGDCCNLFDNGNLFNNRIIVYIYIRD